MHLCKSSAHFVIRYQMKVPRIRNSKYPTVGFNSTRRMSRFAIPYDSGRFGVPGTLDSTPVRPVPIATTYSRSVVLSVV